MLVTDRGKSLSEWVTERRNQAPRPEKFGIFGFLGAWLCWLSEQLDALRLRRPRRLEVQEVRLAELHGIVDAMSCGPARLRYAGLTFNTDDRPAPRDSVNLDLSLEDEKVGFDWVMIAPRNRQDEELFRSFAHARGVDALVRSRNGVAYLRVECDDVADFTARVVTEMYRQPPDCPLKLVHEGFTWPGA
jgi:hypothetical protein